MGNIINKCKEYSSPQSELCLDTLGNPVSSFLSCKNLALKLDFKCTNL